MSNQKVVELERRVNLILRGMNLMLFGEPEAISPREKKEIERRFKQYTAQKRSEFVELKDLQDYSA